jgi:hypothetical protein
VSTQTYTYAGAPFETDTDQIRFNVQDVDTGFWLLSDQEYQWLIDTWMPRYDSLTYVSSVAAGVIARKFAGIVSVSADGVSVNTSDLADRYTKMAQELRDEHKAAQIGGEVDISNVLVGSGYDPAIKPLRFGIGLHDNPQAGVQDFGGIFFDPFADAALSMELWGYQ